MIRIVLADDHAIIRRNLRDELERDPACEVCGEAASGDDAVALFLTLRPDVTVLDFSMPGLSGIEACRRIRQLQPAAEVLIVTLHDDIDLARAAAAAGARGYVMKSEMAEHLVPAVLALARHRPYFVDRFAPALPAD